MYDFKALTFLANQRRGWDSVFVKEYLVCIDSSPTHLFDLA